MLSDGTALSLIRQQTYKFFIIFQSAINIEAKQLSDMGRGQRFKIIPFESVDHWHNGQRARN